MLIGRYAVFGGLGFAKCQGFVCVPNLTTLLKVPSLKDVYLALTTSSDDAVSCSSYGMLIYGLGKFRTDIDM